MDAPAIATRPTWRRLSECPRCVVHRPNLARTSLTAAVVGVVLFLINHLDPVLRGHADAALWVGTGLSFVVPFCVANLGLLVASRRPPARPGAHRSTSTPARDVPRWRTARQALACVVHRRHLARTATVALLVGTVYFVVNHIDTVLHGDATTQVWVSGAVTYLVPFTVANVGLLVASHRVDR